MNKLIGLEMQAFRIILTLQSASDSTCIAITLDGMDPYDFR